MNQTISGLNTIASPSSAGLLWIYDPSASPQDRSFSLVNLVAYLASKPGLAGTVLGKLLSSTPYTLAVPFPYSVFPITTAASAFVFNLPTALSALGSGPVTIIKADSGAGVIQILPNGTDVIDKAGNVSCYLGSQWQSLSLEATASGQWTVVGGTFAPHQTVDTDGSQYELGKLHHLPLGNTTSRQIYNAAPPASGVWSLAQQATGLYGIPAGAKGIRAKVRYVITSTGAQTSGADSSFSDNNSSAPSVGLTAHPSFRFFANATAGSQVFETTSEFDIPLNSSGQFYIYGGTTVTGTVVLQVIAVGYYMGD